MITIANRFKPFSHTPGTKCLLPLSFYSFEIYPARLVAYECKNALTCVLDGTFEGFLPLTQFTVTQDLEKNLLLVTGFHKEGFVAYEIEACGEGFSLLFRKLPKNLRAAFSQQLFEQGKKRLFFTTDAQKASCPARTRLSLGSHKAQDVDLMRRREDLTEILPIWHYLAQSIAPIDALSTFAPSLLAQMRDADKEHLYEAMLHFFKASFEALFMPRTFDTSYQGFDHSALRDASQASPLLVLSQSYPLLNSLFFQEEENLFHILPHLPKQFHCGKIVNLATKQQDRVHLEWTKKEIRRLVIEPNCSRQVQLVLSRDNKRFRVADVKSKRVLGHFTQKDSIFLEQEHTYLFDRFEK